MFIGVALENIDMRDIKNTLTLCRPLTVVTEAIRSLTLGHNKNILKVTKKCFYTTTCIVMSVESSNLQLHFTVL